MREYSFSEGQAKAVLKTRMLKSIPLGILTIITVLYINDTYTFYKRIDVLLLTFTFVLIASFIGFYFSKKVAINILLQKRYILTDNTIIRIIGSRKTIEIRFDAVDNYKLTKKGLLIFSKRKNMLIPKELEGFDELSNTIIESITLKK